MENPNFGKPETVANRAWATEEKYKVLLSKWVPLPEPLTVPSESFLYAGDPAAFRKMVEEANPGNAHKELREKLQARDNQAVVEVQQWMEQVRLDAVGKREPVGGWVIAEMPVGRGEYVGKKTYVKLPIWSSAETAYMLRELPDNTVKKGKEQPKGWLVDFTSRYILVDFEGGKVSTAVSGNRKIVEDAGTEMLVLRPDGKLMVRNSAVDAGNPTRRSLEAVWEAWVKEVEKRKAAAGGQTGEFDRPKN
jgi:hypothetical protein